MPDGRAYFHCTSPLRAQPQGGESPAGLLRVGHEHDAAPVRPAVARQVGLRQRAERAFGDQSRGVAQLELGVQERNRTCIVHAVQFGLSPGIGRARHDASHIEQIAARPDQRALQRDAFHPNRAGKSHVGLQHSVAGKIAQGDVAEARMRILQGIGRVAQQVIESFVEQVEPLLGGANAAK